MTLEELNDEVKEAEIEQALEKKPPSAFMQCIKCGEDLIECDCWKREVADADYGCWGV